MADEDAKEVHARRGTNDEGEKEEDPGEEWGAEVEYAKEVHDLARVAPRPHVDHHESEGRAEEDDRGEGRDGEEEGGAKEEHVDEVCCAAAEGVDFQHAQVALEEEHVE